MNMVYALFSDYADANRAVDELLKSGYSRSDIGVLTREDALPQAIRSEDDVSDGAATGAVVGGIAGLLVGIGALTLPGIGPLIVAGPLAATLGSALAGVGVGAVTGGLVGALIDYGVEDSVARTYESRINEGDVLLTVHAPEEHTEVVESMLRKHNAEDIHTYAYEEHAVPSRV